MHGQRFRRRVEERELRAVRAVQDSSIPEPFSSLPYGVSSSLCRSGIGGHGCWRPSISPADISVSVSHVEVWGGKAL